MKSNETLTIAILTSKCPRCRKGEIYTNPALSIKFDKMHKYCPKCNLEYEMEPGFFFGAMYISYAFSIAILIGCAIALSILFTEPSVFLYVLIVTITVLLATPFSFRFSRVLWLYLFIKYRNDLLNP